MALATTCPQCNTSFKVMPDQLKLRRGTVRCGVCQHVFSGLDHLRYIPDGAKASAPGTPIPASVAARISNEHAADPQPSNTDLHTAFFMPETVFAPTTQIDPTAPQNTPSNIPASIQASKQTSPAQAIDDLLSDKALEDTSLNNPHRPTQASTESDAIDYFALDQKPKGFFSRSWLWLSALLVVLLLAAASQLAIIQRDLLATRLPGLKAQIESAVGLLGLDVKAHRNLQALLIEAVELRASPNPSVYAVNATLRNTSSYPVRWPSLELSLTDAQGTLLARKVFHQQDYLPFLSGTDPKAVPAATEIAIRLALSTQGVSAAGYYIQLFYPE
jgi:predicted Zn finger-like uncharacterized protein